MHTVARRLNASEAVTRLALAYHPVAVCAPTLGFRIYLRDILSVHFGPKTRNFASRLQSMTKEPWRCFSIRTKDRTFDYVTTDDDTSVRCGGRFCMRRGRRADEQHGLNFPRRF